MVRRNHPIIVHTWKDSSKYQNRSNLSSPKTMNTFEVHENTIFAPPGLALAHNNSWHDLLPQVRLSLLYRGHNHVANGSGWQPVQAPLHSLDGNDIQILGSSIVGTIHHGAYRQTQWHPKLVPGGTSSTWRYNTKPLPSQSTQSHNKDSKRKRPWWRPYNRWCHIKHETLK